MTLYCRISFQQYTSGNQKYTFLYKQYFIDLRVGVNKRLAVIIIVYMLICILQALTSTDRSFSTCTLCGHQNKKLVFQDKMMEIGLDMEKM